jgi:hypothetical protein
MSTILAFALQKASATRANPSVHLGEQVHASSQHSITKNSLHTRKHTLIHDCGTTQEVVFHFDLAVAVAAIEM